MKMWIHKIKSLPALDKYVIFSIAFTIVYSVAEFITSVVTSVSHDVLTECVYRFFVGEVIVCALIKIFKLAPKSALLEKLQSMTGFSMQEDGETDDGK